MVAIPGGEPLIHRKRFSARTALTR
jgi:hypothetical protein